MDLSIPVEGMRQAEGAFNSSAASVTKAFQGSTTTGGNRATASDSVDLSTVVTNLVTSKLDFLANLKVAQVDDNLTKSSFSVLA